MDKQTVLTMILSAMAASALAQPAPPATPVSVAPVVQSNVSASMELVGTVTARRRSTVAAQTEGAVEKFLVEEGALVQAGDPLAELNADEVRIEIGIATAAKAELESRSKRARATLRRSEELFEKERIPAEEHDTDLHAAQALVHSVEAAGGRLRVLMDELEKKVVRAPYAGTVTRKHTEVGEWVDRGGAVVDLLDLDPVHVVFNLPERLVSRLDREAPVLVTAESTVRTYEGRIVALIPDADLQAHTLPLKVKVENPDGLLAAGMFARGKAALRNQQDVLLVPKDALMTRGAMVSVYVVEDDVVRSVIVQRGAAVKDKVAVSGELRAGQLVVVRGNERLRPGQTIKITQTFE